MNFDLVCLGLVAILALWGLARGLLRQIFGILGFVAGIVVSRMFAQQFGDAFAKDLGLPVAVATAAMAIAIFFAVEILAKLIGGFLHARLSGGFTGAVNRTGGFLVGLAKGLLVAWALASVVALLRPHLKHMESDTSLRKADLSHSRALAAATEVNLITELRHPPR